MASEQQEAEASGAGPNGGGQPAGDGRSTPITRSDAPADGLRPPGATPAVIDVIGATTVFALVTSVGAGIAPWFAGRPDSTLLDGGPIPLLALLAILLTFAGLLTGRGVAARHDGLAAGAAAGAAVFFGALTADAFARLPGSGTAGLGLFAAASATATWVVLAAVLFAVGRDDGPDPEIGTPGETAPDPGPTPPLVGGSPGRLARWALAAGAVAVVVGAVLPPPSADLGVTDWVFAEGTRAALVNLSTLAWLAAIGVAVLALGGDTRRRFAIAVGAGAIGVGVTLARALGLDRETADVGARVVDFDVHGIAAAGAVVWIAAALLGTRQIAVPGAAARRAVPRRRFLVGGSIAAASSGVVAVFAVGVMVGERVRPESPAPAAAVVVEVPDFDVTSPEAAAGEPLPMPNLVGLTADDARNVVRDLGEEVEIPVVVDEVPNAGEPGHVLAQSPLPGADEPVAVTLTIGAPAPMPDLVGVATRDAVASLEAVGARVVIVRRYDPSATPGTVLASDPPAGVVPADVTITVAAAPSTTYLDLIAAQTSRCSIINEALLAGTELTTRGFQCTPRRDDAATAAFVVSRKARTLTFDVGYTDASDRLSTALVSVVLDGEVARSVEVVFGALQTVEVDVSPAVQLEIVVADTTPEDAEVELRSIVVLGDATLTGSPTELDELEIG